MKTRSTRYSTLFAIPLLLATLANAQRQLVQATPNSNVPSGTVVLSETQPARPGYTDTGMITTVRTGIGTWTTKAPLLVGRQGVAVAAAGGKLYAIGGHDNVLPYNADCEEYDPQTDIWTSKAPLPSGREGAAAASVGGKIYVIGGYDGTNLLSNVEEYDPQADTWTPRAFMPTGRYQHQAVVVDGKIYAISGYSATGYCGDVEVYDPQTNAWTVLAQMTATWRTRFAAAAFHGKIYIAGGDNGNELSDVSIYDPATDTWSPASNVLLNPLTGVSGAFVGDQFVTMGGYTSGSARDWVRSYDLRTEAWDSRSSTGYDRWYGDVAKLDGKLYYVGGFDDTLSVSGALQVFDPGIRTLYLHRKD